MMRDIIGMSFILMYKVVVPFLFTISLMLMVWGIFRVIITVCLRVFIIARQRMGYLDARRLLGDVVPAPPSTG
jgi:hypothetical protein